MHQLKKQKMTHHPQLRHIRSKIKCILFTISMMLFFTKCKNEEKQVVEILNGEWSIDTMIYKEWDVRPCLPINVIQFYNDSVSVLPTTTFCDSADMRDLNSKGIHRIVYNDKAKILLVYNTQNRIFKDTFDIQFIDDVNNKLMKMELQSANAYIVCTKGSFQTYSQLKKDIGKVANIKETLKE